MSKKYVVDYCSGATGYGWREEFDRIDEVERIVDGFRSNVTAAVSVWDNSINDFIFEKRTLCYKPEIDDLRRIDRDYRTKTRRWK